MEDIIRVEHVSKEYRLGAIGGGTLKGDLQSFMARLRGKEDPNAKIGQDVYAKNQRFLALDDISFSIKKGERVGIIGHNGAGKSTLLKLLSRVTAPTKGTISYNGRIASMLEVGTGFHPELTGRENVYLNGAILGMSKGEITEKFDDIVRFAEMEQFIDTPVKRYSSGMYVKLAFAVAAHLDSDILVMDEVLAVGDMKFQQKCLGKMDDVSKSEGRTILYVSHNMNTVRQLCNRCIVMDHGRVVFDGDVEQGIKMYMQRDNVPKTCYTYSDEQRPRKGNLKLELLGLEILNSKDGCIERNDALKLAVHCNANGDVERAKIRFEVYYQDGTIVGSAISDKMFSARKGEKLNLQIEFTTKNFAPGLYKVIALVYEYNEFGLQKYFDRVESALVFEVTEKEAELQWMHRHWGHIYLDNIYINDIIRN